MESLKERLKSTPKLLIEFFKLLLSPEDSHHITADSTERLAESFAQDLLFGITKGIFLTLKHTSIGLGLHNMVDQKLPILILSRLGQSITYYTVREIETAQAELAEQFNKDNMALPIQPKHSSSIVPTIFWWDNFDRFVDNLTGAGSIHNTPGIAFQEETDDTIKRNESSIIPLKQTSILCKEALPAKCPKIDPKKSPHMFNVTPNNSLATNVTSSHYLLSI